MENGTTGIESGTRGRLTGSDLFCCYIQKITRCAKVPGKGRRRMESNHNASNAYHDCINFENVNGKKIAQTKILSLRNPNRFGEKTERLMDLRRKPWRGTWVDSDLGGRFN